MKGTGEVRVPAGHGEREKAEWEDAARGGGAGGRKPRTAPALPLIRALSERAEGTRSLGGGWGARHLEPTNPTVALRLRD